MTGPKCAFRQWVDAVVTSIVFNVNTTSAVWIYDGWAFSSCCYGSLCHHGNHRNSKEKNNAGSNFTGTKLSSLLTSSQRWIKRWKIACSVKPSVLSELYSWLIFMTMYPSLAPWCNYTDRISTGCGVQVGRIRSIETLKLCSAVYIIQKTKLSKVSNNSQKKKSM